MRAGIVLAAACALCLALAAGCCPSTGKIIRMRSDPQRTVETAQKDRPRLLKYFEQRSNRDPIWRAEAMTTLHALDTRLDDITGSQLHARLIADLRREYADPRFRIKRGSQEDAARRLKAWALYTLGKLEDPEQADFFLAALENNSTLEDVDFAIRRAALDALAPLSAVLSQDRALRNRMLIALPMAQAELERSAALPAARDQAGNLLIFLENAVKNYAAVVELLPHADSAELSDAMLLLTLQWNYQKMGVGEHLKPENAEAFAANVEKLLSLAWDRRPAVRVRARVTLATFTPQPLFKRLTEVIESRDGVLAEDYEQLAALLPAADRTAEAGEAYAALRKRAFNALFANIHSVPLAAREVVYARLLECDPTMLAQQLVGVQQKLFDEDEAEILQHLRYLELLRHDPACARDAGALRRIALSQAFFARKRCPAVREQAVACLCDVETAALAASIAAALGEIGGETPQAADTLVTWYIAALERMEKNAKAGDAYSKEIIATFGAHPFRALERPLARPELPVKRKIVAFLELRDPDLLLSLMSRHLDAQSATGKPIHAEEFAMLGDTLQARQAQAQPATVDASAETLHKGLGQRNEEVSLLCCRYLLELGRAIPEEETESLPDSCQALILASKPPIAQENAGKEAE